MMQEELPVRTGLRGNAAGRGSRSLRKGSEEEEEEEEEKSRRTGRNAKDEGGEHLRVLPLIRKLTHREKRGRGKTERERERERERE